ncbi:MAG: lysine exporter LysO family protein [Bacteroidales bacterium]
MRGSVIILSFFIAGMSLAYFSFIPSSILEIELTQYALWCLMFSVGVSIGCDKRILETILKVNYRLLLLPICTIVGSLLGSAITSLFMDGYSLFDSMAVASGFGYYSLSSIFITEYRGVELGTVALLSNIYREIITLLGAPILYYLFGSLAPISAGGATTMDTTLPIITRYSGKEFAVVAIFHGIVVDLSVPFLVTLFSTI